MLRVIALALVGGVLAGCQTDGLLGPEADAASAKPRVIDTAKTRGTVSKPDSKQIAQSSTAASQKTAFRDEGDIAPAIRPAELASAAPASTSSDATLIPAQSLFGNWTLGENGGSRKCRIILGGVLIGAAYSARSEADCPQALTAVQSWEIQGAELVLRNQSRGVVGRLQPTGPFRFDGQAEGGASVYLIR
ncbi:MAG: AprI/Inh family metalloprotease inhibitor [Xanthobacteraceae bacterium]